MQQQVKLDSKSSRLGIIFTMSMAISVFMVFRSMPIFERIWFVDGIIFAFTIITITSFYKTKIFFFALFYCLIVLLNVISGDRFYNDIVNNVIVELFICSIPAAFTYHYLGKYDIKGMRVFIIVFYTLLLYTVVVSLIISLQLPGIIREFAGTLYGGGDTSLYTSLFRIGLSNYNLPHAVPVLIPALYVGVTNKYNKGWVRTVLVILWVFIITLTYLSGATTALLFSIIFSIIVLFIRRSSVSSNMGRLIFLMIVGFVLIIYKNWLVDLISYIGSFIGGGFTGKFELMEDALETGDATSGDIGARSDLYSQTITELIKNPFLGTDNSVGQHSALLDRFACLGIVGFLPYVLFFYYQFKYVSRFINSKYKTYYILGVMIAFFMLLLKYMSYYEMYIIIMTVLPLSLIVFGGKDVLIFKSNEL